jgi:hypothetical protein
MRLQYLIAYFKVGVNFEYMDIHAFCQIFRFHHFYAAFLLPVSEICSQPLMVAEAAKRYENNLKE